MKIGTKIGIAFGSVLVGATVFYFIKKRKQTKTEKAQELINRVNKEEDKDLTFNEIINMMESASPEKVQVLINRVNKEEKGKDLTFDEIMDMLSSESTRINQSLNE